MIGIGIGPFLSSARSAFGNVARRVAEISLAYGGRTPSIPQTFWDAMAVEFASHHGHAPSTHSSVKDGLWSDPTTWNAGTVPGDGDTASMHHHVVYDVESDDILHDVHVHYGGKLSFDTTVDTRLRCDTLMANGILEIGTPSNPVPHSGTPGKPRVDIIFHQLQAPEDTFRLGLMTMGAVRINGERKADRLFSAASIPAGATSVTLERTSSANWRVGDKILFIATSNAGLSPTDAQYDGPASVFAPFNDSDTLLTPSVGFQLSHDEVRTITAIAGNLITFDDALDYDHDLFTGTLKQGQVITLKPCVANLTRSIRFSSDDPSELQTRAHMMFMHSDDIQIRWAEALNMARTDTNPSLKRPDGVPVLNASGGVVITDDFNVRGRYAWHIHGTGAYFGRRQVVLEGVTAWAPTDEVPQPGWAITHHNSRVAIEKCVVYNVRGAGMVSENGNELGQWIDNTVAWCRGDGYPLDWGTRAETWENHNGHAGIAYESQARQILQQGNIASSSRLGWFFMQQRVSMLKRVPDQYSLRLYDPIVQNGTEGVLGGYEVDQGTYGIEQSQIPDFNDNHCFGCGVGFSVAHRQFTDRGETTPMIARGFNCVATDRPINIINYTFYYSFYDFLWIDGDTGAVIGNNTFQFVFVNGRVKDFDIGFDDNGLGFNYNGEWIDIEFDNVGTEYSQPVMTSTLATAIEDNPRYGAMGPWTVIDPDTPNPGYTVRVRTYATLDSATDLPTPYPTTPLGLGGVEPAPGTPIPYFYLDPASDLTLAYSGFNTISISGVIVDHVGVRKWPDGHTSAIHESSLAARPPRKNYYTTGPDIVLRNGCFNDGGTWKSRLYFTDHERLTGEYLQFSVDVTLTDFDTDFLEANEIVPVPHALPLLPETLRTTPIDTTTVAPEIVSSNSTSVEENVELSVVLKANQGHVSWDITGGADAAQFEIEETSDGVFTLRWVSNGTQDYETPLDAGGNNVYVVEVTASNEAGDASTPQTITVTVTDTVEGLTSFSDNFNRANENLEANANWTRVGGVAGAFVINSNQLGCVSSASPGTPYFTPDLGSTDQYAEFVAVGSSPGPYVTLRMTDNANYLGIRRNSGDLQVVKFVAGSATIMATFASFDFTGSPVIRFEAVGTNCLVYRNGVSQTPTSGSLAIGSGPPSSTRQGAIARVQTPNPWIDNYVAGIP